MGELCQIKFLTTFGHWQMYCVFMDGSMRQFWGLLYWNYGYEVVSLDYMQECSDMRREKLISGIYGVGEA